MRLAESFLCLSHTEVEIGPLFQFPGCHQVSLKELHREKLVGKEKFSAKVDAQNFQAFPTLTKSLVS